MPSPMKDERERLVERLRRQAEELDPQEPSTFEEESYDEERAIAASLRRAADLIEELEQKHIAGESIEQALREATAQLAQCYRLTGADPDGDSDSMLAKFAVEEVGRMRKELDENEGDRLRKELLDETVVRLQDAVTRAQAAEERVKRLESAPESLQAGPGTLTPEGPQIVIEALYPDAKPLHNPALTKLDHGWRPGCSCGWKSVGRRLRTQAERDYFTHAASPESEGR